MMYAVHKLTKEHRAVISNGVVCEKEWYHRKEWSLVEADKNGWIPLVRKECPVPAGQDVSVMLLRQANRIYYSCACRVPDWSLVTHYCIPAEQKPEAVETDARPAPSINGQYECVKIGSADQRWWKVTIIAYDGGAPVGKTVAGRYLRLPLDEYRFRSPRTARQKWVEDALSLGGNHKKTAGELARLIHDALLTGALEAPKPDEV